MKGLVRARRRPATWVLAGATPLAAATLLVGCRSTDPALQDSEGRPLESLPPALYSVAVAPLNLSGMTLQEGEEGLRFSLTPEELQRQLVADLRELRAASVVHAVGDRALEEAQALRADLLVRPKLLRSASLDHEGLARGFLSAGLWLTTWVGSFWVEDSTYAARMVLDFDVYNANDDRQIDSVTASSDRTELAFWDRNAFVSWATLQSLVIPPFWTSDQRGRTSRTLSRRICKRMAGHLTEYLKEGLVASERDFLGEVRLQSPLNGAEVGPRVAVKGKVVARKPITELVLYLNDEAVEAGPLASVDEQRRGNLFQVFLDRTLDLRPGRNLVSIVLDVSGEFTSRTILVHNGPEVPAP